jgi:hypothetical protein
MAANEINRRRERELIEMWLLANEGQASEAQLQALSRELEMDSAARQLILSVAQQQGWLVWQGGPTPSLAAARCDDKSTGACRTSARPVRSWWREQVAVWSSNVMGTRLLSPYGMIMVACLCAGIIWWQQDAGHTAATFSENDVLGARIIGGTPCVWDSAGVQQTALSDPLREGDSLQLMEGIAEISLQHYSTAAKLMMEGPAAVLLARQAVPSLRYGKITIETDALSATRFPVETPFGRVMLEPGTEVGVSAFGGLAQVHVFAGVATVESPWFTSTPQGTESKTVGAGEALFFEGVGDVELAVTAGTANRDRFTPQVSMQSDFLSIGPEYVQEVRKSAPVAYWRFDQERRRVDEAGDVVLNEMGDRFHGRIRGKVRWVGPDGNQAIEFGVTPEPGSMVVGESWDEVLDGDFTLEAWIKPSHYHLGSIMGFIGEFDWQDHRNEHGVLLEVGGTSQPSLIHQPERIRFLYRPLLGVHGGVSCFSDRSYKPRRWQHVAAVRDGEELRLFLDGQVVASGSDPSKMATGLQLVLGQLYTETVERFFIGHVDEVAIYDRALDADEIRRHYHLLRSPAKSSDKHLTRNSRLNEVRSKVNSRASLSHL